MEIYKQKLKRNATNVGLFCNARDEKNIKEWAAHHLLIGFDIIIIFDHKSIIPLNEEFKNFDKRVIIIRKEIEGVIKVGLMNEAKSIAKKINLDWFIYLDADEFLILHKKFRGVKHFLNTYTYADQIGINWLMFGSNNLVDEPDGLILENYKRSRLILDQHVKSFVRPNEIIKCIHPHFYNIRNINRNIGINFRIMRTPLWKNITNIPYYNAPAYIAHYVYQSEETYKKRKVILPSDFDGKKRRDIGKEIHKEYNDIINLQPQKYVNQINELLKYNNN